MKSIVSIILLSAWVFGIAVAKGFWMTLFCLIPFISWVETALWLIHHYNIN